MPLMLLPFYAEDEKAGSQGIEKGLLGRHYSLVYPRLNLKIAKYSSWFWDLVLCSRNTRTTSHAEYVLVVLTDEELNETSIMFLIPHQRKSKQELNTHQSN